MPVILERPSEVRPVFEVDDTAIGEQSIELKARLLHYIEELWRSEYGRTRVILESARARIAELALMPDDWDSYGAPAPNNTSVRNARRVLDLMDSIDLTPTRILPSAEGGIGICFVRSNKYADIECSNEGDILGVYYTGQEMPRLLETDSTDHSLTVALTKIREHIAG